jgi:putative hydrolase of the HAD superfamily
MIKAIIFDLDNCLSAADEPNTALFQPAFDAIARANHGSLSQEVLQQAFAEMWRVPFDAVARKYRFAPEMLRAGWEVLRRTEVTTPMSGYGDLGALPELPVQRLLVTSGFRRLQESKVRALGIGPLFTAVHIDAIDEPDHQGKQRIFEAILVERQLRPDEVLIVGDNADSELAAGRRLGMRTVQTLRPGVPVDPATTHRIRSLFEIQSVLQTAAKGG